MQASTIPTWPQWRQQSPSAPFAPLLPLLAGLPADRWPAPDNLTAMAAQRGLHNAAGLPLRFVPASGEKCAALDFERRIFEQGEVQTRDCNWHDTFHACAWALFPRAKARINALHAAAGAAPAPNGRSALRDLLTLFDESGIIIACADPELAGLLAGFAWHELFWAQRARVLQAMEFTVFGHALYEHCHALYDGVTGKGIVVPVDAEYFALPLPQRLAHLDRAIEQYFAHAPAAGLGPRDLQPLPLKGIPGWAPENESADYYRDERQFRLGRLHRPSAPTVIRALDPT